MEKSEANARKIFLTSHDYEKHANLSLQWNRWILRPMGIWPNFSNVSIVEKYTNRLINVVCYGLICYLLLPCSMYALLEIENIFKEIKLFGPLVFCVAAFMKYHWLIVHGDDIRECIEHIKWDWKNVTRDKDREIMAVNANFGKRITTVCAFFMYTGFVFYFFVIPLGSEKPFAEDINVTFIPMAYPFSRFIVDVRYSPVNEIIFSFQIVAGALINSITVGACSLAAVFAVHSCGQMEILTCSLDHLIDGRSDMCETLDRRIASIVDQHVRILKFLELTESALRQVSFAEFLACTLNLCLVGYYIIMEWGSRNFTVTITYVILYISLTFNIFIFCYIGEIVAQQCSKIGETSYMIEWYRIPGNKKLCCVLIMAMSNSSIKFTAGNMVELSINTFSNILKTSVTFLNVLRTMAR